MCEPYDPCRCHSKPDTVNTWYLKIRLLEPWSLTDLQIFYRIVKRYHWAVLKNTEEELAAEDATFHMAEYRFVLHNLSELMEGVRMLYAMGLPDFTNTWADYPLDERFIAHLKKKEDKMTEVTDHADPAD